MMNMDVGSAFSKKERKRSVLRGTQKYFRLYLIIPRAYCKNKKVTVKHAHEALQNCHLAMKDSVLKKE